LTDGPDHIHTLTLDIRNRQLDESNKALDQVIQSREGPSYRLQFYKSLVGLSDGPPGEGDPFTEIPNPSLKPPTTDSDLVIISEEKDEIDNALTAQILNLTSGGLEALAGVFHAIPSSSTDAKPWGVGAGLVWGGFNFGHSTQAASKAVQVVSTGFQQSSGNAARKANLLRAQQDRVMQANTLGKELKSIDKQITTQRIRVSTAEQEIKNHQKALDQSIAVEDFLRSKYTSERLYAWIEATTKTLFQQSYNLAFDLAKRAEKSFNFERPQNRTEFIHMGYLNTVRDGLLAGEQLYLGLKRLETAYQETLGHDFEMTKHISVRQWAPLGLITFREKGSFEFDLPEILFDMDYPGHYIRRITSVSVTVPYVIGPYSSINYILRLL